MEIAQTFKMPY